MSLVKLCWSPGFCGSTDAPDAGPRPCRLTCCWLPVLLQQDHLQSSWWWKRDGQWWGPFIITARTNQVFMLLSFITESSFVTFSFVNKTCFSYHGFPFPSALFFSFPPLSRFSHMKADTCWSTPAIALRQTGDQFPVSISWSLVFTAPWWQDTGLHCGKTSITSDLAQSCFIFFLVTIPTLSIIILTYSRESVWSIVTVSNPQPVSWSGQSLWTDQHELSEINFMNKDSFQTR